jgi:hypothetical protein
LPDLREPTPLPWRHRRYIQHFWDATYVGTYQERIRGVLRWGCRGAMDPKPVEENCSEVVQLAYLAVLQSASDRAARQAVRFFVLRMLASLLLLALIFGVASGTEKIEFFGATLKLAPWTFIVVGSIGASLLLLLEFPQYERAHLLAYQVVLLYRNLGYERPWQDWKEGSSPWGAELVAAAPADPWVPHNWTDTGVMIGLTVLSFLLTIGAEFLAWCYLIDSEASIGAWLFGLLPIATLVLALRRYWYLMREVRRGTRPHLALGKRRKRQ